MRADLQVNGQTLKYVTYAAAKNANNGVACVLFVGDAQVFRSTTEVSAEVGAPVITAFEMLEFATPYTTDARLGTCRVKLVDVADMNTLKLVEPIYTLD